MLEVALYECASVLVMGEGLLRVPRDVGKGQKGSSLQMYWWVHEFLFWKVLGRYVPRDVPPGMRGPVKPTGCLDTHLVQERGRAAGLQDICHAVAEHALCVVGQMCVVCTDGEMRSKVAARFYWSAVLCQG